MALWPRSLRSALFLGVIVRTATAQADGTGTAGVLYSNQSSLGLVQVVHMEVNGFPVKYMLCGACVVGAQITSGEFRGQDLFPIFTLLQSMRFLRPRPTRALVLGLGAGSVPTALRQSSVPTDVIEVNPAVVEAAQTHFGYSPTLQESRTLIGDVREILQRRPEARYDLIIHDLHSDSDSARVLTQSLFTALRTSWLLERGVLVVNFVGHSGLGPGETAARWSQAVALTLRSVFAHVRCYREHPLTYRPEAASNIFCLAASRPWKLRIPPSSPEAPEMSPEWLASRFQAWEVLSHDTQSGGLAVITDETVAEYREANLLVSAELQQLTQQEILPSKHFWEQHERLTTAKLPDEL